MSKSSCFLVATLLIYVLILPPVSKPLATHLLLYCTLLPFVWQNYAIRLLYSCCKFSRMTLYYGTFSGFLLNFASILKFSQYMYNSSLFLSLSYLFSSHLLTHSLLIFLSSVCSSLLNKKKSRSFSSHIDNNAFSTIVSCFVIN